ncbi:MAG: RNA-binding S4 domain-containing protein [Firmicutes bacterium]|nr:RNA-binding S4 domain-containing protein [Bacillota bacterium]
MRLDKYLKVSRLIKRRTVAKEACEGKKVSLNGKSAKPGSEVKIGDIIEIAYGERKLKLEIVAINEKALKDEAKDMYRILDT